MNKNYKFKFGNSLIWVGIALGGLYWVFEAVVHSIIFKIGTFKEELFTDDPMEIWMRLTVVFILLCFGCFAQFMFYKLQKAYANLKILRGSLRICAKCKKIRDDKGVWNQMESYIRDHSEAEFSHSFCQECAKKYYPDSYYSKQ